ncbi:MAG: hypothetical protein Q9203_006520 [Teloschistes exilis]
MIKLRRYVVWARYGDYASHVTAILRDKSKEAEPTPFAAEEKSGQYLWKDVSLRLRQEESAYRQYVFQDQSLVKTTHAGYTAANRAGIDFDTIITPIHHFAGPNSAFHNGLKEELEEGRSNTTAHHIFNDLKDLSSLCPPELAEQELRMRVILEALRDE